MRRQAHAGSARLLHDWISAATRLLRAAGTLTLIWRADGLQSVLDALDRLRIDRGPAGARQCRRRPAIRVIVRAIKGGRAPLVLLPPLA